jgi:curli production assembly/transport component CsgG
MVISRGRFSSCLMLGALALATMAHAQGMTDMKKGEGGSVVKGSAGPGGSQGAASDLERCDKPMATMAVVEPQSQVLAALSRYKLQSPSGLIRLMIQQSNCFLVVERGVAMQNMMQERALAESGQLRQGSNVGGGQMVTADYILTPAVVFSEDNAGGVGGGLGAVGGLFGRGGALAGAVAGGLQFKEAQTSMLVADARSGLQVAAAEGSARKADFRLGGLLGGVGGGVGAGAALGGYANTNEGKVIAASFADNYNGVVRSVRGNPSLQRDVASLGTEAGARTKAGASFSEGDVLRPKIGNVRLMAKPSDAADAVTTLGKGDELIFMGKEQDGFVHVETGKGAGWVKKVLVTK